MTDYATHPDWLALLRGVCEDPADDLPRLVAADWLEENGHGDRAELIRLQIEQALLPERSPEWWAVQDRIRPLLGDAPPGEYRPKYWEWFFRDLPMSGWQGPRIRRGFVESVEVRLDDFASGAFPGFAGMLFRSHPVAEVVARNAAPHRDPATGRFLWYTPSMSDTSSPTVRDAVVPAAIFNRLGKFSDRFIGFYGPLAALGALSRACVALGREEAGLPAPRAAVPA